MSDLTPVRRLLDGQVAEGRLPGYVAAVRVRGTETVLCGGTLALGSAAPMAPDSLFRLASVTKIVGGVLTLALAERGVLALEDEVGAWLPELATPRVTARPGGPLDETVPADRPITVEDLLTNTAGLGWAPGLGPLNDAMDARGIGPGAFGPDVGPDEFLRRLAELPLGTQPGAAWAYQTSSDVLSVLLARATGRTVGALVADHVTGPLGLGDTSFWTAETDRLTTCYLPTDEGLQVCDAPDGRFAHPRPFETLSAGLLASAPDVLAVLTAVLDGGGRVLTRRSAVALASDALTTAQRAAAADVVGPGRSYGLQVGVDVDDRERPFRRRSRWGWDGGTGTSAWVDPGRRLAGVLLTQRMWTGEDDEPNAFWAALTACA